MSSIFDIINVPLGYVMKFCYTLTNNYVFALLLFALILQIVLLPFGIKQQKNSIKQAKLAPKVMAVRKKYAGRTDKATQQKMSQEVMEVYQANNFNPAGGCLPLLIQLPILLSLYNVVINPLRYICGLAADTVTAMVTAVQNSGLDITNYNFTRYPGLALTKFLEDEGAAHADIFKDVSGVGDYSSLLDKIPDFKVGSMDLSITPSINQISWYWLIPLLTFAFALASQLIIRKFQYQSPETKEQQKSLSMKIMTVSMPLMSAWIAFMVPAAIGVYWIFRSIISTVQQILLSIFMPAPHFTEEDFKKAEHDANRKKRKKKPKSLYHLDDDDEDDEGNDEIDDGGRAEAAKIESAENKKKTALLKDDPVAGKIVNEGAPSLKKEETKGYVSRSNSSTQQKYAKTGKKYNSKKDKKK